MANFRSPELQEKYSSYIDDKGANKEKIILNWEKEATEVFEHWAIMPAKFPYDLISKEHDLLVPKRVFSSFSGMNYEEFEELKQIKSDISSRYSFIIENLPSHQSIPEHFHWNLIKAKQ